MYYNIRTCTRTIHSLLIKLEISFNPNGPFTLLFCATNFLLRLGASVLHIDNSYLCTDTPYFTEYTVLVTFSIGTTRLVLEPCRPSPPLITERSS